MGFVSGSSPCAPKEHGRRASYSRARRRAGIAARRRNAAGAPHLARAVLGHGVTRRRVEHCNPRREPLPAGRMGARGPGDALRQPLHEQGGPERYGTHVRSTRGSCPFSCFGGRSTCSSSRTMRGRGAAGSSRSGAPPRRMHIRTRRRTRRGHTWCSARHTTTVWSRVQLCTPELSTLSVLFSRCCGILMVAVDATGRNRKGRSGDA